MEQITSAPVVALILVGGCAIEKLQSIVGEEDPGEAKLKHAMSLRAQYGLDKLRKGFEVSEDPGCVLKVKRKSVRFFHKITFLYHIITNIAGRIILFH